MGKKMKFLIVIFFTFGFLNFSWALDRGKGVWVFLDFHNQPAEVAAAREEAKKNHENVERFTSKEGFEEYLKTHPNTPITTLTMSGHSRGFDFMASMTT